MIAIIITYRNRDLNIVKKCLDSLQLQLNKDFQLYLIDYGSDANYSTGLKELSINYDFLNLFSYPVKGQLWNKSRAINIVLNKITTEYVFIGDIDMMYHEDFISTLYKYKNENGAIYFKVGYLNEVESKLIKPFNDYKINHYSNHEATGMTLYNREKLMAINGYDEYYHGWGSEDTDVHFRFVNSGYEVNYFDSSILMLHQWHPKTYRSKDSLAPFHSKLEQINSAYLLFSKKNNIIQSNTDFVFGLEPNDKEYLKLEKPSRKISITNEVNEIKSFLNGSISNFKNVCVEFNFVHHPQLNSLKNKLKRKLKKKHLVFYSLEDVNNMLIETIIMNYRNNPYNLFFDRNKQILKLIIVL